LFNLQIIKKKVHPEFGIPTQFNSKYHFCASKQSVREAHQGTSDGLCHLARAFHGRAVALLSHDKMAAFPPDE
jgi:hypothetical protein